MWTLLVYTLLIQMAMVYCTVAPSQSYIGNACSSTPISCSNGLIHILSALVTEGGSVGGCEVGGLLGCEGRTSCDITTDNNMTSWTQCTDVMVSVNYTCAPVTELVVSESVEQVRADSEGGFIHPTTSLSAELVVESGRKIRVTLINLSPQIRQRQAEKLKMLIFGGNETDHTSADSVGCSVVVRERASPREVRLCAEGFTEYLSISNTVRLEISVEGVASVSIYYAAVGCTDISAPLYSITSRRDDTVLIQCSADPSREWSLTCQQGEWKGLGEVGTCPPEVHAFAPLNPFHTTPPGLIDPSKGSELSGGGVMDTLSNLQDHLGVMVALVVSIILIIITLVVTNGLYFIKKRQFDSKYRPVAPSRGNEYGQACSEFEFLETRLEGEGWGGRALPSLPRSHQGDLETLPARQAWSNTSLPPARANNNPQLMGHPSLCRNPAWPPYECSQVYPPGYAYTYQCGNPACGVMHGPNQAPHDRRPSVPYMSHPMHTMGHSMNNMPPNMHNMPPNMHNMPPSMHNMPPHIQNLRTMGIPVHNIPPYMPHNTHMAPTRRPQAPNGTHNPSNPGYIPPEEQTYFVLDAEAVAAEPRASLIDPYSLPGGGMLTNERTARDQLTANQNSVNNPSANRLSGYNQSANQQSGHIPSSNRNSCYNQQTSGDELLTNQQSCKDLTNNESTNEERDREEREALLAESSTNHSESNTDTNETLLSSDSGIHGDESILV